MKIWRGFLVVMLGAGAVLALLAALNPYRPVQAKPQGSTTIMIHEFASDTPQSGTDTAYEWFELYNAATSTVALTNWTISDAQASDVIPTVIISPNDFVVVAASTNFTANFPGFTGTVVYLSGSIGSGLNNSGDCLTLADDTGGIIDQASYGSNACEFAFNLSVPSAGQSWEREPIGRDTDAASDWARRTSPTPGYGLSSPPPPPLSPPGSVLISAVHFDGYAGSDNDEGFRLTNVSTRPVTLTDWVVVNGGSAIKLTGTLQPDRSIWVAETAITFTQQFGYKPDYKYTADADAAVPLLTMQTGSPPALGPGDALAVREGASNWMDAVVWSSGATSGQITSTGWLTGWIGPNVQRYSNNNIVAGGQIIFRKLDEATGKIITDTHTALDWANNRTDPLAGRKSQYPGWDLEKFWQAAKVTGTAALTVAIAPDNAYRVISDVLGSAQSSIKMEMYTFDNLGLLDVVTRTLGRGVSVTILLDGGPAGGIDDQELWVCQQIESMGGACWFMITDISGGNRIHARYKFLHAKMIVVDDRVVAIGSENLSPRTLAYDNFADGTVGHRGVYLVTDVGGVVSRALEIWNADFDPVHHRDILRWSRVLTGSYGPPPIGFTPGYSIEVSGYRIRYPTPLTITAPLTFELLTAPESALRASDALLGLINRSGAGDAIDVEQLDEPPHWGDSTSDPIADPNLRLEALISAARRGAKVRLLLDRYFDDPAKPTSNSATAHYIEALRAASPTLSANLAVRLGDPARYGIHNKMFLFDLGGHKFVHAGSLNGTETSNKINREVALQAESSAAYDYLRNMFESDWAFQPNVYLPLLLKNYVVPPNHVLISKVFYLGATSIVTGSEWVQVYNPTGLTVALNGYKLGDQAARGSTGFTIDGMWLFPPGASVAPGGVINVATTAQGFYGKYGRYPDYVFFGAGIQMIPYTAYTPNASFALANTGDEVLLLGLADQLVDGVAWGTGSLSGHVSCLAIDQNQYPLSSPSIMREPLGRDTDNCPSDFVVDPSALP